MLLWLVVMVTVSLLWIGGMVTIGIGIWGPRRLIIKEADLDGIHPESTPDESTTDLPPVASESLNVVSKESHAPQTLEAPLAPHVVDALVGPPVVDKSIGLPAPEFPVSLPAPEVRNEIRDAVIARMGFGQDPRPEEAGPAPVIYGLASHPAHRDPVPAAASISSPEPELVAERPADRLALPDAATLADRVQPSPSSVRPIPDAVRAGHGKRRSPLLVLGGALTSSAVAASLMLVFLGGNLAVPPGSPHIGTGIAGPDGAGSGAGAAAGPFGSTSQAFHSSKGRGSSHGSPGANQGGSGPSATQPGAALPLTLPGAATGAVGSGGAGAASTPIISLGSFGGGSPSTTGSGSGGPAPSSPQAPNNRPGSAASPGSGTTPPPASTTPVSSAPSTPTPTPTPVSPPTVPPTTVPPVTTPPVTAPPVSTPSLTVPSVSLP